jgi:hypothetical protein
MAINKNHEFEELDGVKCGIVEKNVSPARVEFLKKILEYNKFTVVVVPSPPPKVAAAPAAKVVEGEETPVAPPPPPPLAPETFTIGVTDYTYNTINAIYGRLLKTPDGHVVTMAYWQQKEMESHDEVPYYERKN